MWQSTQPISVDGLEIDPVNGATLVLAEAGSADCTQFASPRAAYLISGDAVVKLGGLPVSLHVPKYSSLYEQARNAGKLFGQAADCAQNAAAGLSNADPSSADSSGRSRFRPSNSTASCCRRSTARSICRSAWTTSGSSWASSPSRAGCFRSRCYRSCR